MYTSDKSEVKHGKLLTVDSSENIFIYSGNVSGNTNLQLMDIGAQSLCRIQCIFLQGKIS